MTADRLYRLSSTVYHPNRLGHLFGLTYNLLVSYAPSLRAGPRIGLLASLLSTTQSYRGAGIHTYSSQLIKHLTRLDPDRFQFHAFVGDEAYTPPAGVRLHRTRWNTQQPISRIFWEQAAFLAAARGKLDLIHGLAYAVPLLYHKPSVVTVHDLSFLRFPDAFRGFNRIYLSRMTALSCRRARRVIADSQSTANDLQRLLHIPRHKIDVIYVGVEAEFQPLPKQDVEAHRRSAGWPEQFLLTVGTLEPRKNHLGLLDAYARYRRMVANPLPLLVAGGKGWYFEPIFARVQQLDLESHVHFLGYVSAQILPWLYNAATLFLYPSLYEGFGLPVAEALACGLPAITSAVSSLPEVAGNAAVTLPPDNPEALALAMRDILADPDRMKTMREAGFIHVQQFRWLQTAFDTAAVYERALV